jgi:hypothetical protein
MTFRASEMLAQISWIYKLRVPKAEADRSRDDAKLGSADGFDGVRMYQWKVSAARPARQSSTFVVAE